MKESETSKREEITIAPWINSHQPRQTTPTKVCAIYEKEEPAASYQQVKEISWKKKALAVTALAVTTFGIGMWLCNGYIIPPPQVKLQPRHNVYVVKPGDTLWSIAGKYSDDSQDIREAYYEIMVDNGLSHNKDIMPGQELIIKF